jgi:membrane protein YdbS with pleckstrin-like domain
VSDAAPHQPDPRARALWATSAAALFGVLGALPGLIALAGAGADGVGLALTVLGVGAALGCAAGVAFGRAAWRRRTWRLGAAALELRRGVVVQRAAWIPYDRIQQVDVERGPIERTLGLSQLVVRTAAATTDGTLYGLAPDDAEAIRSRLIELAGVDDAV